MCTAATAKGGLEVLPQEILKKKIVYVASGLIDVAFDWIIFFVINAWCSFGALDDVSINEN